MSLTPIILKHYHVFLATPGDVTEERKQVRGFFDRFNKAIVWTWQVQFDVIDYENYGSIGVGRPQELITKQTLEKYRDSLALVIGVMADRFGTKTGKANSGTEEEFQWAFESNRERGFPEIKWLFRRASEEETSIEGDTVNQREGVNEFKKRLRNPECPVWYREYDNHDSFRDFLEGDLASWLHNSERVWHQESKNVPLIGTDGEIRARLSFSSVITNADSLEASPTVQLPNIVSSQLKFIAAANDETSPNGENPAPATERDAIDLELAQVKCHLDQGLLETAESELAGLGIQLAAGMNPSQSYEWKALRFRALVSRGAFNDAGKELLEARLYLPDTERSRINEALGLEFSGDKEAAHALAGSLRDDYPRSEKLLTIWLRTAPLSTPFDQIIDTAAPYVELSEDVNLAVVYRALITDNFILALPYAMKAVTLSPKSAHSWYTLGEVKHGLGINHKSRDLMRLAREAEEHYSLAITLAAEQKLAGLELAVRLDRAKIRLLLSDPRAEHDLLRSVELSPHDDSALLLYASYLIQFERQEEALNELGQAKWRETPELLLLEAVARYQRNTSDDRMIANRIWRSVAESDSAPHTDEAHLRLVQASHADGSQGEARTFLSTSTLEGENPFLFNLLYGILSVSEGDILGAKAPLKKSAELYSTNVQPIFTLQLIQMLDAANEPEIELPLLQKCVHPGILNEECKRLISVACTLNRHDILLKTCEDLRGSGSDTEETVVLEIQVRQQYDPESALALAIANKDRYPKSRRINLWQALLALRMERQEMIVANIADFPSAVEVTTEESKLVIWVFRRLGWQMAALEYSYDVLRSHFDSDSAHGQYIAVFLNTTKGEFHFTSTDIATPGCAVRYEVENDDREHWVVLEDGERPSIAREEVPLNHPISVAILNRRVGECVTLSDFGIQPKRAEIKEIVPKYVHRWIDCRSKYQLRFPNGRAIQEIHVGSGDDIDLSVFLNMEDTNRRHIEAIDREYGDKLLPLSFIADTSGRDEFETWQRLTSSRNLGVRFSRGDNKELLQAVIAIESCCDLVLDITALMTLTQIGLGHLGTKDQKQLVVPQTVFDRICLRIEEQEQRHRVSPSDFLDKREESSPSTPYNDALRFWMAAKEIVQSHCIIKPCLKAADLAPSHRDQIVRAIGRDGLDAILLSSEVNAALWTDDLAICVLAKNDFSIRRVWTQPVLRHWLNQNHCGLREVECANSKLIGWYYSGVVFDSRTIVASAGLSHWDESEWPWCVMLDELVLLPDGIRLDLCANAVATVWRNMGLVGIRHRFLFAVLSRIGNVRLLRRFAELCELDLSENRRLKAELAEVVSHWWKSYPGILIP